MNRAIYSHILGCRVGRTHAVATACKEHGMTLVVHSIEEAKRVSAKYGINTVSYRSDFNGAPGPYLWDHMAAHCFDKELDNERFRAVERYKRLESVLVAMSVCPDCCVSLRGVYCDKCNTTWPFEKQEDANV